MAPGRRAADAPVTAAEVENIAQRVADESSERAVRKVFAILGVDIDDPAQVETFRDDLRFGRRLRKAADHSWLAFVGGITLAVLGAIWLGIKELLER